MSFIPRPDLSQFEVLARPCADRESRVFKRTETSNAVCYRAYSLALAKGNSGLWGGLAILIEHGGGREALVLHSIYGAEYDWLLTITDERRQYAALWALYKTADDARTIAKQETANRYAQAFAEGRLKKRRRNRRVYVEIEMPATASEAA